MGPSRLVSFRTSGITRTMTSSLAGVQANHSCPAPLAKKPNQNECMKNAQSGFPIYTFSLSEKFGFKGRSMDKKPLQVHKSNSLRLQRILQQYLLSGDVSLLNNKHSAAIHTCWA